MSAAPTRTARPLSEAAATAPLVAPSTPTATAPFEGEAEGEGE